MSETDHCADDEHHAHNPFVTSAQATWHCLSGCVIGEVAGLMIGVSLGLDPWATIALATGLAYLTGFTLGLVPVMRREQIGFGAALKIIWIGEVVSIGDGNRDECRRLCHGRCTSSQHRRPRILDCNPRCGSRRIHCGLARELVAVEA